MPLADLVPQPARDLYARFPLVTLPPSFSPYRAPAPSAPQLWIAPRASSSGEWSSHPRSLRVQLLLRLARVPAVEWKDWASEASAPDATLPALYLPDGGLLAADAIRPWLDQTHALYPADAPHHGYPTPALELEARAFGRLVDSSLYPAFLASLPTPAHLSELALLLPAPAPWWAGLAAPLPMAAWGESRRRFDLGALAREGAKAVRALAARLEADGNGEGWLLGCPEPTALDCLAVAHLHAIWTELPPTSTLRRAVEVEHGLRAYMRRLTDRLGAPTEEGGEKATL